MLRHYVIAALRNLAANPLQAVIAIGGLAIGLWAAILAGVIAVNQTAFDDFLPGAGQLYLVGVGDHAGGAMPASPHGMAELLSKQFAAVQATTRLSTAEETFSRGAVNGRENYAEVDPDFFRLVRLPVLFGDPNATLARPDEAIITRAIARKYFGRDDARGQTLLLAHKNILMVTAVIADPPVHASNFDAAIYISDRAPSARLARSLALPSMAPHLLRIDVTTVVRLAAGGDLPAMERRATEIVADHLHGPKGDKEKVGFQPDDLRVHFMRLDQVNLSPQLHPLARERLTLIVWAAALILLLAAINFVNLTVARACRRTIEVGIRKASGAGRFLLMRQFLGEAILQVFLALAAAILLTEWSLPVVNAFLETGARFPYWREPGLAAILLASAIVLGLATGAYPAFVLSGCRPAWVMRGVLQGSISADCMRQLLVGLQFAILLVLLIAAAVVFQQNRFTTTTALRLDTSRMLVVRLPVCGGDFQGEVTALPGVHGVACTGPSLLPDSMFLADATRPDGSQFTAVVGQVGFGFFPLYHLPALAGRVPSQDHPGDAGKAPRISDPIIGTVSAHTPGEDQQTPAVAHYVINETLRRAMRMSSAQAAIGNVLNFGKGNIEAPSGVIVGVVNDFSLYPPLEKTQPTAYWTVTNAGEGMGRMGAALHLRLSVPDMPQTLAAIDMTWKRHSPDPISRIFLSDYAQQMEIAILREGQALAAFAAVACLLGCLGLFGLALASAERRTKEIGVRKAMGATTNGVVALLLWQFARPVLWANLIAWPVAWWGTHRWLAGFAYHVELGWWVFVAASATALLIALLTVGGQAWLAARQKPVLALRYE